LVKYTDDELREMIKPGFIKEKYIDDNGKTSTKKNI
jgi:hypothetical protein